MRNPKLACLGFILFVVALATASFIAAPAAPALAQTGVGSGPDPCPEIPTVNVSFELVYDGNLYTYPYSGSDLETPDVGTWLELDIQTVNNLVGAAVLTWRVTRLTEFRDGIGDATAYAARCRLEPQT